VKIVVKDETAAYGGRRPMYLVYRADHYAEFEAGKRVKTGPMNVPHLVTVASIQGYSDGSQEVYLEASGGMGARSRHYASKEAALAYLESLPEWSL
jgi:hypothetical protein